MDYVVKLTTLLVIFTLTTAEPPVPNNAAPGQGRTTPLLGLRYSAATDVSHISFNSPLVSYGNALNEIQLPAALVQPANLKKLPQGQTGEEDSQEGAQTIAKTSGNQRQNLKTQQPETNAVPDNSNRQQFISIQQFPANPALQSNQPLVQPQQAEYINTLPQYSTGQYPAVQSQLGRQYSGIQQQNQYPNVASQYPAGQPQYPDIQAQYPTVQPQYPTSQPQYPVGQPQYPVAQPQYPVAQPQYPVQPQYPSVQPQYPAVQPQYPAVQPQYPGVQAQYPEISQQPNFLAAQNPYSTTSQLPLGFNNFLATGPYASQYPANSLIARQYPTTTAPSSSNLVSRVSFQGPVSGFSYGF